MHDLLEAEIKARKKQERADQAAAAAATAGLPTDATCIAHGSGSSTPTTSAGSEKGRQKKKEK